MNALHQDLFVSVDIEADGPIPGVNSMLQIGAAAFCYPSRTPISTFTVNLKPLPGATVDPETAEWWLGFPSAWAKVTKDPVDAGEGMALFRDWVQTFKNPVLAVYPSWDYMWLHWYFMRFCGANPFGLSAFDMKSFGAVLLRRSFKKATKPNFPKAWFNGAPPHTHVALDDAIGQGVMLMSMLEALG